MVRFSIVLLFLLGFYSTQYAQSTVKGIVKDGSNGDPVENAKITLVGSEKRCLSDANGVFELAGVPKGKYSLEIKASTFNIYVLSDVTIGDGAIVQAQSGVAENIPAGKVYFGTPAGDAKHKLREIFATKQLPSLIHKLYEKDK